MKIMLRKLMTLICAKLDADLISISEVTSRKTKWPRFFGLPCIWICVSVSFHLDVIELQTQGC